MQNVLLIGAGDAARIVLKTLGTTMKDIYNVVGLIDDNTYKTQSKDNNGKILAFSAHKTMLCK